MIKCPKCHAKLLWGYPPPAIMAKIKFDKRTGLMMAGDVIICGCVIEEKNYCPKCGALV